MNKKRTAPHVLDVDWFVDELTNQGLLGEKESKFVLSTAVRQGKNKQHPISLIGNLKLKAADGSQQILDSDFLTQWLAQRCALSIYKIDALKIDVAAVTAIMTLEFAQHNRILPVEVTSDKVVIATDQPFNTDWESDLAYAIKQRELVLVLVNPEQLTRFIPEFYRVTKAIKGASSLFGDKKAKGVEALLQLGDINNPDANDQHIVRLVDWVLQYAFEQRASDIHLEPKKETGKVRFRIDGILHDVYSFPIAISVAIVARIKILGRMNVAEKRKPQDGRLKTVTPAGIETELRLSILPTAFGEKLVMRIFDPEVLVRSFEQLGFRGDILTKWQQMAAHPNGIILVTGPTGSGKTTTLYSTLKQLATEAVNVSTVEDPIEMIEPSFNQLQVQSNIDLNFSDGIRALMRQDPDVIMVGEIRDYQTAEMAIQAALTGHLVLSTLHTNDAPSSLTRLHDLGVAPFLSAATILGVMAQRLVRTLCEHCKQEQPLDIVAWEQLVHPWKSKVPQTMYVPVGCEICRHSGYKGRIGLYEIMILSNPIKRLITENASLEDLKQLALKEGLEPLRLAGARRVSEGLTSIAEVLRVVPLG